MHAKSLFAAVASAALIASAAGALAQDRDVLIGGPGPMDQQALARRHAQAMADVRTLLRLRPDQESAFAAFQSAMAPFREIVRREAPDQPRTTPQMLDEHARMEADMKARMDQRQQAIRAFYAALSAEQQKAFDALMRLHPFGGPGGPGHREVRIMRMGGPGGPHGLPPGPMGGPPPL